MTRSLSDQILGAEPTRKGFLTNYPPFRYWRPEAVEQFLQPRPLNLYLHIPYCIQRCAYCFYKVTTLGENRKAEIDRYVAALCQEITMVARRLQIAQQPVHTVYFGGGTPTVLSKDNLSRIFATLREHFHFHDPEITVEAEPVSLIPSKAEHLQSLGVNRISMGIQSFKDDIVARTGRVDTEEHMLRAIAAAMATGAVVNVDLMSGLAGETDETWDYSVSRAIESGVHSITVYKTEVYTNAGYYHEIKRNGLVLPSDEQEFRFTAHAIDRLARADYLPVNSFTFTRGGRHMQQHATSSWQGRETYGFGVSAFGLLRGHALQNTSDVPRYVAQVEDGQLPLARGYRLSTREMMTRDLALGMKLIRFDRREFQRRYGLDVATLVGPTLDALVAEDLIAIDDDALTLTRKGILWGDYVGHCLADALEHLAPANR